MAKTKSTKATAKTGRVRKSPIRYLREVIAEVKKVSWPSPKELTNYTIAVIVVVIIFAVIVGAIDFGLTSLFNLIT